MPGRSRMPFSDPVRKVREAGALASLALLLCCAPGATAQTVFPGAQWQTRSPAEVGVDEAGLDAFRTAIDGHAGSSGVVVKDGYLIYSWGDPSQAGGWASATKPLYSTLLLFALEEGRIDSVDDSLEGYGWNLPAEDDALSLRHLANNVSGYALDEPPGAAFAYNDYGIALFWTTLLERVYGVAVDDSQGVEALMLDLQRLGPLQLQDGPPFLLEYDGTVRAFLSPRDFARIGWFWLNRGRWGAAQLLPQSRFDTYVRSGVSASLDRTDGNADADYLAVGSAGGGRDQTPLGPGVYGFNWWFNDGQALFPDAPPDTFQANGRWNSAAVTVIPSLGVVAAWRGAAELNSESDWNLAANDALAELSAAVLPEPGRGGLVAGLVALGALRLRRRRRTAPARASALPALLLLAPGLQAPAPASAVLDDPSRPEGQLIVDPEDPRWLKRNGQGSFFIAGAGDPEDFLYRGTLLPDGTRDGDQLTFIGQLEASGANALYLQAVRSHGDGGPTEDPWNSHGNPASGLNDALLDQWEGWFDAMDAAGIVIYFFFYDDGCCVAFGGIHRQVGAQESAFVSALVDRFEHYDNLIWVIAEEYEEGHSPEVVQSLAAVIRAADDRDHVIGVHQGAAIDFDFLGVQPIEHFSMQIGEAATPEEAHALVVAAQALGNRQVQIKLAEAPDHYDPAAPDRTFTRRYSWAAAMAGATVTVYRFEPGMPQAILADHGRLASFFSAQELTHLESRDDLARLDTDYVLAAPSDRFLLYARDADGALGVAGVAPDFYTLRWLDVVSGVQRVQSSVWLTNAPSLVPPSNLGSELAVSVTRLPEPGGPALLAGGALALAALARRARGGCGWPPGWPGRARSNRGARRRLRASRRPAGPRCDPRP